MSDQTSKRPFRILSLDGGGTFALIQAKVLADLYPGQNGHEVLSHFDLVSACSGGSIVMAALVEGYAPAQIVELFDREENRCALFGLLPWYRRLLRVLTSAVSKEGAVGFRFSTDGKRRFLERILPRRGRMPLHALQLELGRELAPLRPAGARPLSLLVVTYDFDRDRARMLRTDPDSPAANFPHKPQHATLIDAAHASSTAPIDWFDRPAEFGGRRYWDGAMTGYNNPVLAGVVEALAMGVPRDSIAVLSIGTSSVFLPEAGTPGVPDGYEQAAQRTGFVPELVKVGKMIIADPPDAHTYIAHLMTGGSVPQRKEECPFGETAVIRMNPVIQPVVDPAAAGWGAPQGWTQAEFRRLVGLDIATTRQADVELIKRMCDGWMADRWHNQPIRSGGSFVPSGAGPLADAQHLCEIGHHRYGDARAAWRRLGG